MKQPEVSVVMSVYNSASYLEAALDSILAQQDVELEFVIIDDGSTDASTDILAAHAKQDARIRLIRQDNQGLTRALIRGCREARSEFIARQDSDDVSLPRRLATQLRLIRSDQDLAFVSSSAEVMGPEGEALLVHQRAAGKAAAVQQLLSKRQGPPGHGSVLFRRSFYERVGGYREAMYFAQDIDLWFRFALVGGLDYAPEVLYRYRVAPSSISGRLNPVKLAYDQVLNELHQARLAGLDEEPILQRALSLRRKPDETGAYGSTSEGLTNYFIARCLINQRDSRALGYLIRSLQADPLRAKAWASIPQGLWIRVAGR